MIQWKETCSVLQNSSRSLSLQGLDVDALPYKILLILPAAINAYIGLETESESISGIEKTCNTLTFSKGNWAKPIELESESDIFLLIIVLWWKSRNYKIYGQSCKMSQIWQIYLCKFGWTEMICVKNWHFATLSMSWIFYCLSVIWCSFLCLFLSKTFRTSLHRWPSSPQAGGSPGGRMSPNPRMLGGTLPTPPPLRPPNTGKGRV